MLNSANPSVVLQGVIVDSLNFNHITYATFSITNPQSGTEMTVAALPLPVTLPPGNYFLVLQGISGTAWWTGSDGSFSLSAGALGGNMFSSSGLWDYEPGMGQAFYKSDWPVAMFELNGKLVADSDGDGVLDVADQCPNSILTRTVIIGQRNSGVSNQLFSTGCTTSDLIAQAASSAKTHGQFMSAVDDITNELMKIGAISESEKDAIQSCAAKTKIP